MVTVRGDAVTVAMTILPRRCSHRPAGLAVRAFSDRQGGPTSFLDSDAEHALDGSSMTRTAIIMQVRRAKLIAKRPQNTMSNGRTVIGRDDEHHRKGELAPFDDGS